MRYVIDACALINLAATGREQQLLESVDARLLVTDLAYAEVRFLDGPLDEETGEPIREPIDLSPVIAQGRLAVRSLSPDDDELLVRAAERLLDADASCATLAGSTGLPLLTDDAKLRRVARELVPGMHIVGSIAFLRGAVEAAALDNEGAAEIVSRVRHKASFLPPRHDPEADRAWFADLLLRA